MPTLYALNMTVDLSSDSSGFFNAYVNNNISRCWLCSTDNGATWSPCNNGSNNADSWGPTLAYSLGNPAARDQVQFAVFYINLPANAAISSPAIYVTFGRLGRTNSANAVAGPFMNGNNTRTLLGDEANAIHSNPAPAYFIGPYTLALNPAAVTSNGTLNFEFSMNAKFTVTANGNAQTYEYGYDPELDVDVGN
jgi:hypothetical protein